MLDTNVPISCKGFVSPLPSVTININFSQTKIVVRLQPSLSCGKICLTCFFFLFQDFSKSDFTSALEVFVPVSIWLGAISLGMEIIHSFFRYGLLCLVKFVNYLAITLQYFVHVYIGLGKSNNQHKIFAKSTNPKIFGIKSGFIRTPKISHDFHVFTRNSKASLTSLSKIQNM